jgi:hypothetical protein
MSTTLETAGATKPTPEEHEAPAVRKPRTSQPMGVLNAQSRPEILLEAFRFERYGNRDACRTDADHA